MKPTKPDRWERMVKERMEKDGGLWSDSAADLLRKEHAAVVRIVARCQGEIGGLIDKGELLEQLKRREK